MKFAAGVGLSSVDLDQISVLASQRAWEAPGWANLLAFDLIGQTYSDIFLGAVTYASKYGVFTVGGGLVAEKSSLTSFLNPGFMGIMDETRVAPPASTDTLPRMSWCWIGNGDCSQTHGACSASNTRYDLVHAAVVRSDLTVTRHFKDSSTGAKTSQTLINGEGLAVNFQVTAGTETTGTPTMPSLPANRHACYAVRVTDTGISEVHDFAIPTGTIQSGERMPIVDANLYGVTSWAIDTATVGGVTSSNATYQLYLLPPEGLLGNPNARLLGVQITHTLKTGDTVKLVKMPLIGTTPTDLLDITTKMKTGGGSPDGSLQDVLVDLRGLPSTSPSWQSANGQGATNRMASLVSGFHPSVALKITQAGSGSKVTAVTWSWISG